MNTVGLTLCQLHPYNEEATVLNRMQNGLVASLADVGWIDRDEEDLDEDYFGGPR